MARYWTWVFFWITILSYGLVYPYIVIFPLLEIALNYLDPANIGVSGQVMANPTFWFVIILCYIITFGTRFAERTGQWVFRPHDAMILAEKEAAAEAKGGGIMTEMSGATRQRLMALGSLSKSQADLSQAEAGIATSDSRNGRKVADGSPGRPHTSSDSTADGSLHSFGAAAPNGSASNVDTVREWDKLRPGKARQ